MTEEAQEVQPFVAHTYTVPEAGRLANLSRNAAYEAARRGEIPTIKLGKSLRVPKKKWDAILAGD